MKVSKDFDVEKMIEQYGDMVYRLARLNGNTKENAEDIFQEVFLRLVRYRDRLQSEEHVRNWLIRVTINCSKSYRRKWMMNQTLPLDETLVAGDEREQSEAEYKVYLAVKSLPEKYRTVIHLYYYEELSVVEIAACLNRREGTVKSQLARGREMLKKKLE